MTEQTIPADLTREDEQAVREWAERILAMWDSDNPAAKAAHIVLAALPKRPTLADMTPEEREECRWMQADVEGDDSRVVILVPDASVGRALLLDREPNLRYAARDEVTPRPDLPPLPWPGTEKPAPAPALPDGWRLADHKDHGRVIVTTTEPDEEGDVFFVYQPSDGSGADTRWCTPAELTYIDTEQESPAPAPVPENTLAVGSEWDDAGALARACRESGRDQIIALDRDGDAYVWSEASEWWESVSPRSANAPYTILHAGKKADQ